MFKCETSPKIRRITQKNLSPFLKALDVKTLIGKLETSNGENLQKFASVLRLVYPLQYNPNAFIEDNEERKKFMPCNEALQRK